MHERTTQTFIKHRPQGLLVLISDHKKSPLVSISAVKILSKMVNYQINVFAEQVVRILASLEP